MEEIRIKGRGVAVTGAGGFIGAAVCRRLADEGAAVTGIDVAASAAERIRSVGAEPRIADVGDPAGLARALDGAELVVHTAAIVSDAGAMADHVRVNVRGTASVLDAAEAAGAERVVHLSSVVVYGYDRPGEQDETAHRRAVGVPYIDTKSASDRLACRRGAVVVRPGDVYGPRSVPWALRPLELARAGRLAVTGDGTAQMLPVYLDDLVEAIVLGLRRGRRGEAYAAWKDDEPVSFEQFFSRFAKLTGTRSPRRLPRRLLRTAGMAAELGSRLTGSPPMLTRHAVVLIDRRGSVSAAKARRELGWEPQVGLDEGMRRTAEWLRAEGLL